VGSFAGAASSQKVTEEFKGWLVWDGNPDDRANPYASLTARPTSRAVPKGGVSDPLVRYETARAQRIKATPGITG